ncbi:hypothetical protein KSS87_019300 [Heliosperma pusillum]|nr:hypothetical protein KSS87_019300 [Heliosperma pusillum]
MGNPSPPTQLTHLFTVSSEFDSENLRMAKKNPENVVAEIGKQLAQQSRPSKQFIVKSLRQAASVLLELEQLSSLKPFINPLTHSLIKHGLLRHKDKDVRLLVAVCFCEIIRVLAPDPSFEDNVFKDIFELFISMFMELADTASPYFSRRAKILETVATLECCRRMLDLRCDYLILKMFTTFFSVIREEHQQSLTKGILSIMSLILNEEEETPQALLELILQNLLNKGESQGFISPFFWLAVALDKTVIVPLQTDQVDIRIKAVSLIGRLLAVHKAHDFHGYHDLFVELLKRFSDKSADVRISVIHAVKRCYLANPSGIESHKVLSCLGGRLLDPDASVRVAAVSVVCDLGKFNLKKFPDVLVTQATDRLRDKMTLVRKEALRKLLEVYREYCSKCYDGQMPLDGCYEQIPCKVLVLSLDKNLKEFRPQYLELLLAQDLFPASLPGQDRMGHWIYLYSLFTPAHVKALNLILCQKKRFQSEMRGYLSLRIKEKGIHMEEVNSRTRDACAKMSATFVNSTKVEECFCKLNELKDTCILFPLMQLLDEPALLNGKSIRDKYLKDVGEKHSLFEFLELLSLKCSNNIFSSEHIHHILDHVSGSRCRGNHVEESAFNLLSLGMKGSLGAPVKVLLCDREVTGSSPWSGLLPKWQGKASLYYTLMDAVRNFPLLLRDSEDQFKKLILEEDSTASEKLLLILAKLGPSISMELSQVYPLLERLCLEGTRAQSKAAVSIIVSSLGFSEESLLVDLCQKLVESLHRGWKIPTALQSLGCILQHSFLSFQQHVEEVTLYIREQILDIYGLKTLVKSVLPKKGTHGGEYIGHLMDFLSKVLLAGEFACGTSACESDVAHMRLAAAKCILRLSRRWDLHITPHIFHSTIMIAKDTSPSIRKAFLDKTYKLLKRHVASSKFACAFVLAAMDCIKDLQDASLKYLVEFVKEYGREANVCLPSSKEGSITDSPEYIVVFLLHALAHDAEFPSIHSHDEEQFAKFCRPLILVLHVFVNPQHFDGNLSIVNKTFLHLRSIFRAIRRAEDAVHPEKSLELHVLADIGIFTLNLIQPDDIDLSHAVGLVLLPSSLYRTSTTRKINEESCSRREFVNEEFVRKLAHVYECSFSQVSSSSFLHAKSLSKGRVQGQNVIYSLSSKQADMLKDLKTQTKIVAKEMSRTRVLEACPKVKKQKNLDGASVIKEFDADGFQKFEHQPGSKSSNLELFGMESDISTQDFDVSLSVSQNESTKKSSYESTTAPQLSNVNLHHACSSDGSNVSFLGQRDAKKKCVRNAAETIDTDAGEGTAETQGTVNSRREILLDKTNSFTVALYAVNGLPKNCQPKSCAGNRVLEIPASDISDANMDAMGVFGDLGGWLGKDSSEEEDKVVECCKVGGGI